MATKGQSGMQFSINDPSYRRWLTRVAADTVDDLKRLSSDGIPAGDILEILGMVAWGPAQLSFIGQVQAPPLQSSARYT